MKEYAFDVKIAGVIRVKAKSESEARDAMLDVVNAVDVSPAFIGGFNEEAQKRGVTLTEVSLDTDDVQGPYLFEVDGEEVDNCEED